LWIDQPSGVTPGFDNCEIAKSPLSKMEMQGTEQRSFKYAYDKSHRSQATKGRGGDMDSTLLATQVRIPPTTRRLVCRSGLVDTIQAAIPAYKLILLSAPAGYGKTTLLSEWARERQYDVAWISIGEESNDPERFFRCLYSAWEIIQPRIEESALALVLGSLSPSIESAQAAFIDVASTLTDHTVFVLDDTHLIADESVLRALSVLIDRAPPMLHFMLAGRGEPALPLARYRARGELLELRAADLRFSAEQTDTLLKSLTGLDLGADKIAELQAQLEGWVAGLQLVALGLQRGLTGTEQLVVTGKHRFVADYLTDEILTRLPENDQQFLLQTSILDRVSGQLCDAVTGKGDGQQTLERLEREDLFLEPLDDRREWFRFHPLFASVLQEELKRRQPEGVDVLHYRAALWYLENVLPESAFHHAVRSGDIELVSRIADRFVMVKLYRGEFSVVQGWLQRLPQEWYAVQPMFGLARVGLLMYTGQVAESVRCLDEVEQLALSANPPMDHALARVTAVRCFIACVQNDLPLAERLADEALRLLPADDLDFRVGVVGALGDTYRRNGHWEKARTHYLKTFEFTRAPVMRSHWANVFGALADLDLRQGHLRSAADHWRRGIAAVEDPGNWGLYSLPETGWLYVRMSELLYEWDQLDDAQRLLERGLERAELGGDAKSQIAGYLTAAQINLAEGNVDLAAEYVDRVGPLVDEAPFPDLTGRFQRCRLEVWLAQGKLRAAVDWSDLTRRDSQRSSEPDGETTQLALARILIVRGDAPSRADVLALLGNLVRESENAGRTGVQIEALALKSLAEAAVGDRAGAMTSLERALRLAEPEGYLRLFADLGLPMVRLLQEARSRTVMPAYVSTLLQAAGGSLSSDRILPEPLSMREQQVLTLMAAGLTNREIADDLAISPQTVKKHADNIYGKLGVRGRTEAAARARALDLLA
jgi:LuxR family maltose regulon positive regulatory protein